jgi:hypothetical protein
MITALCNDHDFGHKELSLIPCNGFLKNYRASIKEFIMASIAVGVSIFNLGTKKRSTKLQKSY